MNLDLYPTLKTRGLTLEKLETFGCYWEDENIVIPIYDSFGDLSVELVRQISGQPKYINRPRGVTMPLYNLHKYTNKQIPESEQHIAVIFESPFDVMAVYPEIKSSIALAGTGISKDNIRHLQAVGINRVILCMDLDAPGKRANYVLAGKMVTEGFTVMYYHHYLKILQDWEKVREELLAARQGILLVFA